jgi:hypothetical protein
LLPLYKAAEYTKASSSLTKPLYKAT